MVDQSNDRGRREFLKRAGTVAWAVPTIQAINMTAASAGVSGSVVSTTTRPSTTTTTTTTEAPQCGCRVVVDSTVNSVSAVRYNLLASVPDDCGQVASTARYVHPNTGQSVLRSIDAGGGFFLSVNRDNLPVQPLSIEVLDAAMSSIGTCEVDLEIPAPPCSCSLRVLEVEPRGPSYAYTIQAILNDDCTMTPTSAVVRVHPNTGGPFFHAVSGGVFTVVALGANLPATVDVALGDSDDLLIAECSVDLELPPG